LLTADLQIKLRGKDILNLKIIRQEQYLSIRFKLNEEIYITLFAGMETEKDISLLVTHQNLNGAVQEDAKFQMILKNGNQISTTAFLRKEMLSDINKYLIESISECDITSVDHFATSMETVIFLLETICTQVLDDIFYCTEIDLTSAFKHIQDFLHFSKDYLRCFQQIDLEFFFRPVYFVEQMR
jgi:hypothetical protein